MQSTFHILRPTSSPLMFSDIMLFNKRAILINKTINYLIILFLMSAKRLFDRFDYLFVNNSLVNGKYHICAPMCDRCWAPFQGNTRKSANTQFLVAKRMEYVLCANFLGISIHFVRRKTDEECHICRHLEILFHIIRIIYIQIESCERMQE